MSQSVVYSHRYWKHRLPYARMVFPPETWNRVKYVFWRCYTPFHPLVRDTALALGVVRHDERQDYLLGTIADGQDLEDFVNHCLSLGYGNHFIAWRDKDEVLGLRLVENFTYQYHIRVFTDGEVRGHYEFTPECYPILHMKKIGQEDRRHVFYEHLGKRIVPSPPESA